MVWATFAVVAVVKKINFKNLVKDIYINDGVSEILVSQKYFPNFFILLSHSIIR